MIWSNSATSWPGCVTPASMYSGSPADTGDTRLSPRGKRDTAPSMPPTSSSSGTWPRSESASGTRPDGRTQPAPNWSAQTRTGRQTAEKEELAADPSMKRLDDAERHAAAAEETAARTTHDAARASALVQGRAAKQAAAAAEADGSRGELTMALARLRDVGRESGIDTEPVVAPLNLPDGPCGQPEIEAARRSMAGRADSRDEAVKRVLELAETAMAREEDVRSARAQLSKLEAAGDAAADKLTAARASARSRLARSTVA